jgi:hypothetical protein
VAIYNLMEDAATAENSAPIHPAPAIAVIRNTSERSDAPE